MPKKVRKPKAQKPMVPAEEVTTLPLGALATMPGWARVVAIIGFPTFVAMFLLAQNAGILRNVEAETLHQLGVHAARAEVLIDRLTIAIRVMCENASKTEREYYHCASMGGGPLTPAPRNVP